MSAAPDLWYFDPNRHQHGLSSGVIVRDLGERVARLLGLPKATEVVAEVVVNEPRVAVRDGQLLAAAPDLLHALEACLRLIEGEGLDEGHGEVADLAREAIAKARGEAETGRGEG